MGVVVRIICPNCKQSNRARRKTCGLCKESIHHLREFKKPKPKTKGPQTKPREWPPNGTEVSITRSRHGWHDGMIGGVLVRPGCVKGDDGCEYEINKPGDLSW